MNDWKRINSVVKILTSLLYYIKVIFIIIHFFS